MFYPYSKLILNGIWVSGNPLILSARDYLNVGELAFEDHHVSIIADLIDVEDLGKKRPGKATAKHAKNVIYFVDSETGDSLSYRRKQIKGLLQYCPLLPHLLQIVFVYGPTSKGHLNFVRDERIAGRNLLMMLTQRTDMTNLTGREL